MDYSCHHAESVLAPHQDFTMVTSTSEYIWQGWLSGRALWVSSVVEHYGLAQWQSIMG